MNQEWVDDELCRQTESLFLDLHRHPELSWNEVETQGRIRQFLTNHGVESRVSAIAPGLICDVEGSSKGPRVFVRADIDALPIHESKLHAHRSTNEGVMHACGHDFHSSNAASCAVRLWKERSSLKGLVRFFFQPAEEVIPSGSLSVVRSGEADGFDAFVAIHAEPKLDIGKVRFREGAMNAAVDAFDVHVQGSGGHSARPADALNPLPACAEILLRSRDLTTQELGLTDRSVLVVTSIDGGSSHNVIPSEASLRGTLRTNTSEARRTMHAALVKLSNDVSAGYGVRASVAWKDGASSVFNESRLYGVAKRSILSAFGDLAFDPMPEATMGGDDFSFYGEKGPLLLMRVGVGTPGEVGFDLHHPEFKVDSRSLRFSVPLLLHVVKGILSSEDFQSV